MLSIFFADLKVSKSWAGGEGELFKYKSCMENRLKRRKTVYFHRNVSPFFFFNIL